MQKRAVIQVWKTRCTSHPRAKQQQTPQAKNPKTKGVAIRCRQTLIILSMPSESTMCTHIQPSLSAHCSNYSADATQVHLETRHWFANRTRPLLIVIEENSLLRGNISKGWYLKVKPTAPSSFYMACDAKGKGSL